MRPESGIVSWFEENLEIKQGARYGEKFTVLPWQREFLEGFQSSRISALTIARGNGKTAFCGGLAAAALLPDGPLFQPASQIQLVAGSKEQATQIFNFLLMYVYDRVDGNKDWKVHDSANHHEIKHRPTNTLARVLSSDAKRAHGGQPSLILCDEPAKWPGWDNNEAMWVALLTSLGKMPDARVVCLGTKPGTTESWFSRLIRGEMEEAFVCKHVAGEDDDPFDPETWRKANPSMDHFPTLREAIERDAGNAQRDRTMFPMFQALRLNLGGEELLEEMVIEPSTWKSVVEVDRLPPREGPMTLGVDLSTSKAMTGACAYWHQTGRLEAFAAFPGHTTLRERGQEDGVGNLYERLYRAGEVAICGNRTVDLGKFIEACVERFGEPAKVIGDHFRQEYFLEALERAGLGAVFEARRPAGENGKEDLERFRVACLDGHVKALPSKLIIHALARARTKMDMAGREIMASKSQGSRVKSSRDDVVSAMLCAVGAGRREAEYGGVWIG